MSDRRPLREQLDLPAGPIGDYVLALRNYMAKAMSSPEVPARELPEARALEDAWEAYCDQLAGAAGRAT